MNIDPETPSLGGLLRDLRSESMTLLRQEIDLAKTEFREKSAHFLRGALRAAIGGVVAFAGLMIVLFGLGELIAVGMVRAGLEETTAMWLAPLLLGIVVLAVGWGMIARARQALRTPELVPEETLQSLRDNQQWAKNKLHTNSHEPEPAL